MKDLLKNADKRYLPIETSIKGFSHFNDTSTALYISDGYLNLLNLETGEIKEFEEFEDVMHVKCLDSSMFALATNESIYLATLENGKIRIQKEFEIGDTFSRCIDSTSNGEVIALSAFKYLYVIVNNQLEVKIFDKDQYAMALSADGKYIASGDEKEIHLIDAISLDTVKKLEVTVLPICMSFSPDGKTLVYGDDRANLFSIELDTKQTIQYSNPYCSKPVYIAWLDEGSRFVVSFLSQVVGIYNVGNQEGELIPLDEFPSRYFQHAGLIDENTMAICVEDLRTQSVVESIPTSDVVVLLNLSSGTAG